MGAHVVHPARRGPAPRRAVRPQAVLRAPRPRPRPRQGQDDVALRPLAELAAMLDFYYCLHWHARNAQYHGQMGIPRSPPGSSLSAAARSNGCFKTCRGKRSISARERSLEGRPGADPRPRHRRGGAVVALPRGRATRGRRLRARALGLGRAGDDLGCRRRRRRRQRSQGGRGAHRGGQASTGCCTSATSTSAAPRASSAPTTRRRTGGLRRSPRPRPETTTGRGTEAATTHIGRARWDARRSLPGYAFRAGGWTILSLNSEEEDRGDDAPQVRWLRAQLGKPGKCRIAFWHRPRFTAGRQHGDDPSVAPISETLAAGRRSSSAATSTACSACARSRDHDVRVGRRRAPAARHRPRRPAAGLRRQSSVRRVAAAPEPRAGPLRVRLHDRPGPGRRHRALPAAARRYAVVGSPERVIRCRGGPAGAGISKRSSTSVPPPSALRTSK